MSHALAVQIFLLPHDLWWTNNLCKLKKKKKSSQSLVKIWTFASPQEGRSFSDDVSLKAWTEYSHPPITSLQPLFFFSFGNTEVKRFSKQDRTIYLGVWKATAQQWSRCMQSHRRTGCHGVKLPAYSSTRNLHHCSSDTATRTERTSQSGCSSSQ